MRHKYYILVLILAIAVSCKNDTIPPVFTMPELSQKDGSTIKYHEATIVDTVSKPSSGVVVKLFYSTDSKIGTSGCTGEVKSVYAETADVDGKTKLTSQLSNLTANTTYYYVYGYISEYNEKRRGGFVTSYSETKQFTTLTNGAPIVATVGSAEVGFYTAVLTVEKISDNAECKPSEWGVCYSTNPNPTISDSKMASSTNDNVQIGFNMNNLTPGTKYYFRAYGKNTYGTSYGDEKSFTTVSTGKMTLETKAPSEKGSNYAILTCDMQCDKEVIVSEKGFCYSTTNSTPTTEKDNSVKAAVGGTPGFQAEVSGLSANTTYYVRAYAICQYGKVYGNVITFITEH